MFHKLIRLIFLIIESWPYIIFIFFTYVTFAIKICFGGGGGGGGREPVGRPLLVPLPAVATPGERSAPAGNAAGAGVPGAGVRAAAVPLRSWRGARMCGPGTSPSVSPVVRAARRPPVCDREGLPQIAQLSGRRRGFVHGTTPH
jgi:hypothetical protein